MTLRSHDCGVLYAQVVPKVNMCYPPLTWQTYDIDFTAARYDAAGQKTKPARCTVKFNGVVILDNVEIKGSTPAGIAESPAPGSIYLQAHGLPVFFKNVWIVEQPSRQCSRLGRPVRGSAGCTACPNAVNPDPRLKGAGNHVQTLLTT